MNEADTRAELIDPLLTAPVGVWWTAAASGVSFRLPPAASKAVVVAASRSRPTTCSPTAPLTEDVAQAKDYASKLQLRFTYASNGLGVYAIDMATGKEGEAERFLTLEELWTRQFAEGNAWRDRFAAIPYADKGGSWQILWKLFPARWNRSGQPSRRPRILFLADRNTLADQAFNDFTGFAAFEDLPDLHERSGGGGQTLALVWAMSGGANNESTWRGILEYFAPAVQLGLTATPRRTDNADT